MNISNIIILKPFILILTVCCDRYLDMALSVKVVIFNQYYPSIVGKQTQNLRYLIWRCLGCGMYFARLGGTFLILILKKFLLLLEKKRRNTTKETLSVVWTLLTTGYLKYYNILPKKCMFSWKHQRQQEEWLIHTILPKIAIFVSFKLTLLSVNCHQFIHLLFLYK